MTGAAVAAAAAGAAVSGGIAAGTSGKGGKKQPTPPDAQLTAQQQFDLNKQGTNFDAATNRYQQYGPSGSVTWQNFGDANNPSWVQNTNLSPENQKLYNQQLANQNSLASQAGTYGQDMLSRLNSKARTIDNTTFNQVAKSQLDRMMPGLDHQTQMLQTQLANQGLAPGGDAYKMGMLSDSQGRNDANLAAINSAMNAQVQENGMINQNEAQNNANQTQALTNLGGLLAGSGQVNIPTYGGSTAVSSTGIPDIASLINQQYGQQSNQVTAANNVNQSKNNQVGSAAGNLGSAVTTGLSSMPKTSSGQFIW
jgi:hypothetical protein